MFIDTHTHIYTDDFDADRAEVVARAVEAGARALLLPNIDEASIGPMLALCDACPGLCFPMMGLHPTELPPDPWPLLDRMEQLLAADPGRYVAVGEVGIDLYWDRSRRDEQIATFRHQARWALRYDKPLVVHSRSAHPDLVATLREVAREGEASGAELRGVFHCFGGSAEVARELLTAFPGFVLGIGGVVTFKKAHLPETLRTAVPLSRVVVETDAPYLTPSPHRGERNEPAYVPHVLDKLAEVYELPRSEVDSLVMQTTRRLFALPV